LEIRDLPRKIKTVLYLGISFITFMLVADALRDDRPVSAFYVGAIAAAPFLLSLSLDGVDSLRHAMQDSARRKQLARISIYGRIINIGVNAGLGFAGFVMLIHWNLNPADTRAEPLTVLIAASVALAEYVRRENDDVETILGLDEDTIDGDEIAGSAGK
jgi:hypothetical protein